MAFSGEAMSSVAGRVICLFCGLDLFMLPLRTGLSQERPGSPDSGGSHFLSSLTGCRRSVVGGTAGHSPGKPRRQVCKNLRAGCFQIKGPIVLIYFCAVLAGGPLYTLSWKTMHSPLFSWERCGRLGVAYKGPSVGLYPRVAGGRLAGHDRLLSLPPASAGRPQRAGP